MLDAGNITRRSATRRRIVGRIIWPPHFLSLQALSQSTLTIVTTAAPYQPGKGDQGPNAPYNGGAKFYQVYSGDTALDHDLRISHIAYDRTHTTATDSNTWFPLPAIRRAEAAGRIGAVAPRFHGAPTNRSHRITVETDAPEILSRTARTAPMPPWSFRTARSAIRPARWSLGIWRRTASRPW